jgi:hypothetical protein
MALMTDCEWPLPMIWLLDKPLEDMVNDFEYVYCLEFESTMNELESVGR